MRLSPFLVPLILIFIPTFLGSVFAISPLKTDTLEPGQQLRDWEQLMSAGGIFTLGFFTPKESSTFELGSAGLRYLGIWPQRSPFNPVWVGNPTESISDSSGSLSIDVNGVLKITQANAFPILVNQRLAGQLSLVGNVSATLLDSGNFVVREIGPRGVSGRVLWQSFDHPTNTLLPGMKIGFNLRTKKEVSVTSWISDQVPLPGAFRLGLDPSGANQLLVWRHGEIYWSSGILTNNGSSHLTLELSRSYIDYEFKFDSDKYMKYFSYSIKKANSSVLSSWFLDTLGQITVTNVLSSNKSTNYISESSEPCKTDLKNSSAVCITEKPTACRKGSEYFEPRRGYMMENKKGYFNSYYVDSLSSGLSDCHQNCWRNCSCIAFQAFSSNGCQYWGKGSKFVPYDSFTSNLITYVLDSVK
ncbi:PREDICTED: G-type lectin S-receptor-like serine/threonine-protein kinase At1g67520 isoform X1 [Camelina sativa]|uniref:G-type lectin S-receptor-like serine/threonine-protein kinase At1g67520 isoform X1 n=1 Tax=Camelina sativa TaxID=90675 RepID=A0ABM0VCC5_CAMSA|nr:PREDICTED: G-type lectin S-receptor-like serine/threonine-protein kinase At1g67520 isoform X1 [Camelina sativa]